MNEKPESVKIVHISIGGHNIVYGLGDDLKIYFWYETEGKWFLNARSK